MNASEPLCDIIIPVWDQVDLTRRCLDAIRNRTRVPYRLILIDNGSAAETRKYLEDLAGDSPSGVILIRNPENRGYLRAVNQGLSRSTAPYLCLLNNDIEVTGEWLERLLRFSKAHPRAGLINCQQNHDPGRPRPRDLEAFARTQVQDEGRWMELDHSTGGCLFFSRQLFLEIGFLDEAYGGGHWEDNDYARRAQAKGYRCVRLLDTYVWHEVSASFKNLEGWREEARRNEILFYQRWGKPLRLIYPLPEPIDLRRARFQQIFQTAHALARKGCQIHLILGRNQPLAVREILATYGLWEHENLRLHQVSMLRPGMDRFLRLSWGGIFHWAAFRRARGLLRDGKADAIFIRHLKSAAFFSSWKKFFPVPLVFEAHEIFSRTTERKEKAESIRKVEQRAYSGLDGIVAITGGLAALMRETFSLTAPMEVIPDGVNLDLFQDLPPRPPGRRVVYAGQLYPWKGVEILVEAMRFAEAAELHLVGGSEDRIQALKELAVRRGVKARVFFHGQVPASEVRKHLAGAAVAALPLTRDLISACFTSPLKLFEYMAARAPILAADLPSAREVLANRQNALLVPPEDPEAWGRGMIELMDNRALAEKLAEKAFEDVQELTWEKRAERLMRFIRSLGERAS
jgi:GT2 family glycosyltransferase